MVLASIFDILRVSDASSIEAVRQLAAKSVSLQEFVHQVSQHFVHACQDAKAKQGSASSSSLQSTELTNRSLLADVNHHPLSSSDVASSPLLRDPRASISFPDNKSPSSTDISRDTIEAEFNAGWPEHRKVNCSEPDEETLNKNANQQLSHSDFQQTHCILCRQSSSTSRPSKNDRLPTKHSRIFTELLQTQR